jgi:hypothetical protein
VTTSSPLLKVDREGSTLRMELAGSASIAFARELHAGLVSELLPDCDVVLRLDVDRLDASGLQLVLAVRAWLEQQGRKLTVEVADGPALRALQTSAASQHLHVIDPTVPPAPAEQGELT